MSWTKDNHRETGSRLKDIDRALVKAWPSFVNVPHIITNKEVKLDTVNYL